MKARTRTIALAGLAIVAAGAMLVQSQVKNQNRDCQLENAKDGYRVDVRLLSGRDALNCLLALENTENVVGNDTKTKRALALVILQSVSTMASDPQPADWQLDSESVQFLRDVRDAWPEITKSAKCGSECEELLLDYINAKIRNDSGKMACIHNLSDSASDKNSLDIPGICEIRLAEMSSSPCLDVDPVAGLDEIIVRERGAKQKEASCISVGA